jgi:hypothetical protein
MSVKGATSSTTMPASDMVTHDKIAMRAYEKWCKRGRPGGSDKQDWLEAERELREEHKRTGAPTPTRR